MSNNMTIGPAVMIGGNEIQMTNRGKVQVTNPKGKVITLSQDSFQKQTLKNLDKLENGEDIQYKKEHKALKIATATAGVAVVAVGVIKHKQIAEYMKTFSWKKLWNDITSWFKPVKKEQAKQAPLKYSVCSGEKAIATNAEDAKVARETLDLKNKANAEFANNLIANIEKLEKKETGIVHINRQRLYERLFA